MCGTIIKSNVKDVRWAKLNKFDLFPLGRGITLVSPNGVDMDGLLTYGEKDNQRYRVGLNSFALEDISSIQYNQVGVTIFVTESKGIK